MNMIAVPADGYIRMKYPVGSAPELKKFCRTQSVTVSPLPELKTIPLVPPLMPAPLTDTPCITTFPLPTLMVMPFPLTGGAIRPALALDGDGVIYSDRSIAGWVKRVDFTTGTGRIHCVLEMPARRGEATRTVVSACRRDKGAGCPGLRWHGRQRDGERKRSGGDQFGRDH